MNSAKQAIRNRLALFPPQLAPLVTASEKYLRYCSAVDLDGVVLIGHMPWVAPEKYALCLYPPAKTSWFSKYAKLHDVRIRPDYRAILSTLNGCRAFGLNLFGLPPSMLKNPPLLSRSVNQCLDLGTANKHWARTYPCGNDSFHIGGRHYSYDENVGYFMSGTSHIVSLRKTGEVVGEWNDFGAFLKDELEASMSLGFEDVPEEWWH